MKKAAESLGEQNKTEAAGSQVKALEAMRREQEELKKLTRKLAEAARNADLARQKQAQQATAEQTKRLAEKMGKADSQGNPTPGQKDVSSAAGAMEKASSSLGKGDPSSANVSQRQALEHLKQAAEKLKRALEKEKESAQQEALTRIQDMLQKVLDKQRGITKETLTVYKQRVGPQKYNRAEILKLAKLSDGEGDLAKQVDKILQLLRAEGTTTVFPAVLEEIAGDLRNVQNLLAGRKAGPITQSLQKGIENNLEELIKALKKESRRRKKKRGGRSGGGGGGGGGGKQPLVPPVAELKMLRALQVQINKRTIMLDAAKQKGELSKAELKAQHEILAKRQEKLIKLTQALKEKLSRLH